MLRAAPFCVAALHSPEQCLPLAHGFGERLGLHSAHAKGGGVHELGGTALVARDVHEPGTSCRAAWSPSRRSSSTLVPVVRLGSARYLGSLGRGGRLGCLGRRSASSKPALAAKPAPKPKASMGSSIPKC